MRTGPVYSGAPDRLYTLTGGRRSASGSALDLMTRVVGERGPVPGMPSEAVRILALCRRPVAVAELAGRLGLPLGVVRVLLGDLIDAGCVAVRRPTLAGPEPAVPPAAEMLEKVLRALQNL
ncbi:DUF742 domain-containing protein [Actinacidiphila yeochonensis]|uniref:DUF742 domain-containing protein n=1 Tax=Actinacidiphila yeochonensis TaxID=89050 RepID=UPI0005616FC9|nr:DUF742 domain-containing protein [Actinacidiphila yeochonensis]